MAQLPAEEVSCSAEVRKCSNGQFVGKSPELNCEFYPCPGGGGYIANWQYSEQSSSSGGDESSTTDDNTADATNLSGWGSTPLTQVCSSDGLGNCGLCHGDCNSDADCQAGLMCFSRGSGEVTTVPGCISGGEGDKPGMDYCYSPSAPENNNCGYSSC